MRMPEYYALVRVREWKTAASVESVDTMRAEV